MKKISLFIIASICNIAVGQQVPAAKQAKTIAIINATIHIGNGQIIENGTLVFSAGKIIEVGTSKPSKSDLIDVIDAANQHLYPGFIAPNSTLGLVEIDAVKASDDESEIGAFNPHIRSIIAYNPESKIIETARQNGILMAQITPRGSRIAGTSSVVQLDAWNWQESIVKENDGIHIEFPQTFRKSGWWAEPGANEVNKDYIKQIDDLNTFFADARAYNLEKSNQVNLVYQAMNGLFTNTEILYIHANNQKQIIDAVGFANKNNIKKMVIVGGYEAYKVANVLVDNKIAVLLKNPHNLPENAEQDVNLPYKNAKLLFDKGVLFALENSGDKERMNTRNLPFLAGTCAAYGIDKEEALKLITLNSAKILGIDAQCGSLEVGKDATLFLSKGDALDMRTNKVVGAFIQGRKISLKSHQTELEKNYKEKYGQN